MKKLYVAFLIILLLLPLECENNDKAFIDDGRLKVVTSFYIIHDFTDKIGKDKIQNISLLDSNEDAHHFEFTSKEIILLESADIFFYNGMGLETWIDDIKNSLSNKNLKFINTSMNITPIEGDPHVWLSIPNALSQLQVIKDTLISYDEANKQFYENNFNSYSSTLNELHNEYVNKISTFSKKDIVVSHEAYGYLCYEYGLNQIGISDIDHSHDYDPQHLTEIIDFIKENNVTTIFYEPLGSKDVVNNIANQAKVNVDVLNPIEGLSKEDIKNKEDYISIMRKNLFALEGALK